MNKIHQLLLISVFFQISGFSQNKKELNSIILKMKNDSALMDKLCNEKEIEYKGKIEKKEREIFDLEEELKIKNKKLLQLNKDLNKSKDEIDFIRDSIKYFYLKVENFERYLVSEGFDNVIDGKFERNKAGLIKSFNNEGNEFQIDDFSDIKYLYNLEKFYMKNSNTKVINVDFSNLTNLESVTIKRCSLENIILDGCSNLKQLILQENNLKSLNINDCISLTSLQIRENILTELDISSNKNLEQLWAKFNQISKVSGIENIPTRHSFQDNPILSDTSDASEIKTCNCLKQAANIIVANKDYDPQLGWEGGKEPSLDLRISEIFMWGLCPKGCEYLDPDYYDSHFLKLNNLKMCSDVLQSINNNNINLFNQYHD